MNTVTFKFDVGDEVYFLTKNGIEKSQITRISYYKFLEDEDTASYSLNYWVKIIRDDYWVSRKYSEEELFLSKEELLKHLAEQDI